VAGPAHASGRGPGYHPGPAGDIQDPLAAAQAHALYQISSPDRGDRRHEVTLVEFRRIAVQLPPLVPVAGRLTCHVPDCAPPDWPRLAWLRDCSDYEGVSLVLVLVLVGAGAAIWWRVSHAKWDLVRRVVFWVVLVVVLWVLVNYYSVPLPEV